MSMVSWHANIIATETNIDSHFAGTNTPWVTSFPGLKAADESSSQLQRQWSTRVLSTVVDPTRHNVHRFRKAIEDL